MRLDHITECGWHLGLCRKPLQRLAKIPSALDDFTVELVLLAASGVNCGTWTLLLQLYGVVPAQKAFQISYWQSTPCPFGAVADRHVPLRPCLVSSADCSDCWQGCLAEASDVPPGIASPEHAVGKVAVGAVECWPALSLQPQLPAKHPVRSTVEALVPCGQYWDAADSVIFVMHLTVRGTKCPGMLTHCWRVLMCG